MRRCTVGAAATTQDAPRGLVAGGSRRTARMRWRSWARTTAARSSGRSLLYGCMHACMYSGRPCRDLLRARARLCAAADARSFRGHSAYPTRLGRRTAPRASHSAVWPPALQLMSGGDMHARSEPTTTPPAWHGMAWHGMATARDLVAAAQDGRVGGVHGQPVRDRPTPPLPPPPPCTTGCNAW